MRARAHAKVNFGLEVGRLRRDGLHDVRGIFQSIDLSDRLSLRSGDDDSITAPGGGAVVDEWDNLAWKAVSAAREAAGSRERLAVELEKVIPVAAGLGGGSADAAAALAMAGRRFGLDNETQMGLARRLGSDVPFCTTGGTAIVSGVGESVDPVETVGGFAIALVVPPIELSTAAVFSAFDRLDDSPALEVGSRWLPPALRGFAPLRNDLYPAAAQLAPSVDEWRGQLATIWDRPVLMTGSGPSLFAFFLDADEAAAAFGNIPIGARAVEAVNPIGVGWSIFDDE